MNGTHARTDTQPETVAPGWAALLGLLLALGTPWPGQAAELVSPPGQNVALQEDLLRRQVTEMAEPLLGKRLLEVVVHIGYLRTQTRDPSGRMERVKLPGFNNFITGAGGQQQKIISDYTRIRQIFVLMSKDPKVQPEAIERELRAQGKFFPANGDWLQVVAVGKAETTPQQGEEKTKESIPEPEAKPEETQAPAAPQLALSDDPLREAKSTKYLLRARTAYFKGDYPRALDRILQAITTKSDNSQAFAMLGSVYYTMNWKSLALKYWKKSLALDPDNEEIESLLLQLSTQ